MEKVINVEIPEIVEKIFVNLDNDALIHCLSVSQSWKILAESVLMKRWSGNLKEACVTGKTEIVKFLLQSDSDSRLNIKDNIYGRTAFLSACENGDKDVVEVLLEYSDCGQIDFNARDSCERTAFILACCNGHKDIVNLILEYSESKSIDLDARSDNGWTASKWASMSGQKEISDLLTTSRHKQLKEG